MSVERRLAAPLHAHHLRHESACQWLEKGRSLAALQQVLGHAPIERTQRYARLSDEAVMNELKVGRLTRAGNGHGGTEKDAEGRSAGRPDEPRIHHSDRYRHVVAGHATAYLKSVRPGDG